MEGEGAVSFGASIFLFLCLRVYTHTNTHTHAHTNTRTSTSAPKAMAHKRVHNTPKAIHDNDLIGPLIEHVSRNLAGPNHKLPIVLGIAGGSGSGKTTLARAIREALGEEHVTYISHDSYYKDLRGLSMAEREKWNFDHPDSLDTDLLVTHVQALMDNQVVEIPTYDYKTHTRATEVIVAVPNKVVLVEGILIFAHEALQRLMDIKIFVDTEDDIRLIRRIERDVKDRGRTVDSVVQQYLLTVRPMHKEFVEPSKRCADIIVPVGINSVALELVISRLRLVVKGPFA